jgi:hypothetical protein
VVNIFPRHRTSGGRIAVVAALAGAVVLALTVFAGNAGASTTSPQKIRQVSCRTASTFNVYRHVGLRSVETCYTGTGSKVVLLHDIYKITTGANTGVFVISYHGTLLRSVTFYPKKGHDSFRYSGKLTELDAFAITRD